jgi:hypothetical protein
MIAKTAKKKAARPAKAKPAAKTTVYALSSGQKSIDAVKECAGYGYTFLTIAEATYLPATDLAKVRKEMAAWSTKPSTLVDTYVVEIEGHDVHAALAVKAGTTLKEVYALFDYYLGGDCWKGEVNENLGPLFENWQWFASNHDLSFMAPIYYAGPGPRGKKAKAAEDASIKRNDKLVKAYGRAV